MNILNLLQTEFNLKTFQVENTLKLIDEGNTIPFIARYRKELTGSMDDQLLREFHQRLLYLRNLDEKRKSVKVTIESQGNLTEEISAALEKATTITEIEDIYRPFKPKRRTRATMAKEKGLEPLANLILEQEVTQEINILLKDYVNEEVTEEEALQGAMDIIAEVISDNANLRSKIRKYTTQNGLLVSKVSKENEESVYEMYYDFNEPINKIAGHRVLAINRGEKEGFLNIKIDISEENIFNIIYKDISKGNKFVDHIIKEIIEDSYKRLISPSIEREIRAELTQNSQDGAIKVFGENLKQLLLQPPIKDKIVLALDPGFRTGCKLAVVDETGMVLDTNVIYPTPPQSKIEESKELLINLIEKHKVNIIAIGNGTACRETENFVAELIKEMKKDIYYIIVNESGASVYSASKLAAEEFPNFDVALRSAVSIARRLQDPLAELVKIDPKSIGVGQYQHDMNQKRLGETLGGVVEGCVNSVGVDLNTASPSLLSYVSGISASISKNILEYREQNGKFKNRKSLLKVKKLGQKAYEQCAGFLRVNEDDADNPLDATGVHPESYKVVQKILNKLGYSLNDVKSKNIKNLYQQISNPEELAKELEIGLPTLKDIIKELEKPGRDPREDRPSQILRQDVLSMEDLEEGMILQGTVRNVIDFGAFVDIGVHQDGLVHISRICNSFIKHPLEVISVGDIVSVKVIEVDINKKRIALSIKDV